MIKTTIRIIIKKNDKIIAMTSRRPTSDCRSVYCSRKQCLIRSGIKNNSLVVLLNLGRTSSSLCRGGVPYDVCPRLRTVMFRQTAIQAASYEAPQGLGIGGPLLYTIVPYQSWVPAPQSVVVKNGGQQN